MWGCTSVLSYISMASWWIKHTDFTFCVRYSRMCGYYASACYVMRVPLCGYIVQHYSPTNFSKVMFLSCLRFSIASLPAQRGMKITGSQQNRRRINEIQKWQRLWNSSCIYSFSILCVLTIGHLEELGRKLSLRLEYIFIPVSALVFF
jgi:hypothetical protein